MHALIVYESMYGNTRRIAEAIAEGIGEQAATNSVTVACAGQNGHPHLDGVDLLVIGGPTHVWSMSRPRTRVGAEDAAAKPGSKLTIEPGASGPGVREWLARMPHRPVHAAAFDTRLTGVAALTGQASRRIRRELKHAGAELITPNESFVVTKATELVPGEQDRARRWGIRLASTVTAALAAQA